MAKKSPYELYHMCLRQPDVNMDQLLKSLTTYTIGQREKIMAQHWVRKVNMAYELVWHTKPAIYHYHQRVAGPGSSFTDVM